MQIQFTPEQLELPEVAGSREELNACLQCGYCLDKCPTYRLRGGEYDSPRGRVYLIKQMFENGAPGADTVAHLDRCLSCLACMAACPSSVHFMHLMDHARAYIEKHHRRPWKQRLQRAVLAWVLPYPARLRHALRLAKVARRFSPILPGILRPMVADLPPPARAAAPAGGRVFPAAGPRRLRVALLTGCVQSVLGAHVNEATIRVLRRHGCEVVVPEGAGCCGALPYHMGRVAQGRALAARTVRAWMRELDGAGLDAVVINTSGCGTVVKDYGYMLKDESLAGDAGRIAALAKDVSELLQELELQWRDVPRLKVAYHATCSLQYGQRLRFTPKKLLRAAGFQVLETADGQACCGSAGTYRITQPDIAQRLKIDKVRMLERGRPDAIAAGNIGCMVHIGSGTAIPVLHTVELIDWATGGPEPAALRCRHGPGGKDDAGRGAPAG